MTMNNFQRIDRLRVKTCGFFFPHVNDCLEEGKRPLGRPRRRWVDNIELDLREIGWDGVDWIYMSQDRNQWRALVNTVLNLRVP
jgi:hypothetical protein